MRRGLTLALWAVTVLAQPRPFGSSRWQAQWVDAPGAAPNDYGVYHFRRNFRLDAVPAKFVVHASGDNRYELYVNGKSVARGPASGDPYHWRYETVDIAPLLVRGANVLAAVVWNDGKDRALAFHSVQTAFILQADDPANAFANSGADWRAFHDTAYQVQVIPNDQRAGYYVAPPNEIVDGAKYPWFWQTTSFDDSTWQRAHVIGPATLEDAPVEFTRWRLMPRTIPLDEQRHQVFQAIRDSTYGPNAVGQLVAGGIPAHTKAWFLLDQGKLTTAYPEISLVGGLGARVELHYAESLYVKKTGGLESVKGNRNEIEGKTFFGPHDTYIADGSGFQAYRPLYWRTFRYLKLEIETQDQPLAIKGIESVFSAYPFVSKASFEVDAAANAEIQQILATGFHTARLCAHETYMDCPFYEQLQYAGDARIQMLVSLFMTGDARLMRNGIEQIDSTRLPEGLTYSRAPSASPQFIPGFSLWWIAMVHDYLMYVDDAPFVRRMLPGVRSVLEYFARYQKPNGSMNALPWWNYADWVPAWPGGIPPADSDGGSSAIFDLQLALAYRWAADIERAVGNASLASEDDAQAARINRTVWSTDWDAAKGMLADQPSHRTYSQHTNSLAILSGAVPRAERRAVLERVLADDSPAAHTTIYFRAYTNAALREAEMGDRYLDQLNPWRRMLADGLTTWAETDGNTRSDCHAWGASPNYELFRTVAGIDSIAAGFARVRIAPNPGSLRTLKARVPHPKGEIAVEISRQGESGLKAIVTLPAGITGEFVWRGAVRQLTGGTNRLTF